MRFFTYFDIKELFINCSDKEILECINNNSINNLFFLLQVLDNFRDFAETPVCITSSYRDLSHNTKVKGSKTSQHLLGQAIDFYTPKMPHSTAVFFLRDFFKWSALEKYVGQVFIYDNFFHIGLRTPSHKNLIIYDKRTGKKFN